MNEKRQTILEEAEKYSKRVSGGHNYRDLTCGFIAGAEWQKKKMMKDAVEGYVTYNYDAQKEGLPCVTVIADEKSMEFYENRGFKLGDKVKIIIIKDND